MQVDLPWGEPQDLLPSDTDAKMAEREWRQLLCVATVVTNKYVGRMQELLRSLATKLLEAPAAIGLEALAEAEVHVRTWYNLGDFKAQTTAVGVEAWVEEPTPAAETARAEPVGAGDASSFAVPAAAASTTAVNT